MDTEKTTLYEDSLKKHLKRFKWQRKSTQKAVLNNTPKLKTEFILGLLNTYKKSGLTRLGFLMWAQAHNVHKQLINLWATSTENLV